MKSIPARVEGDFVLIQHGQGFHNAVLAGGDRPRLADRGYLEAKIYTYSSTPDDQTFEEYEPGRWRRYVQSIWNKRLTDVSELRNATIYKMPRYQGVLIDMIAWPLHTANGTAIEILVDRPAGVIAWERGAVAIADPRARFLSPPQNRQTLHEALHAEGWRPFMGDGGWCKVIPVTDLELEPEAGVPKWLQQALAEGATKPFA